MTQLFLLQKIGAKFYMGRAEITKNNLQILIPQTVQVFNAQPESAVTIQGQLIIILNSRHILLIPILYSRIQNLRQKALSLQELWFIPQLLH